MKNKDAAIREINEAYYVKKIIWPNMKLEKDERNNKQI
jgi:hypothetical protein